MGDHPSEPVELYRARSMLEAYALRARLEDAGVSSQVDNEMLQGIVGEVPGGWVTAPRLLVSTDQLAIAQAVLAEFLSRPVKNDDGLNCLSCGAGMGDADSCSACGWTYTSTTKMREGEALTTVTAPESIQGDAPIELGPPPDPVSTGYVPGWGEVCAVLAVGVVPNLLSAVQSLFHTVGPTPYWIDSLALAGLSACTIYVTLYLIRRSGQPWKRFGLTRPESSDLFLGFGMLLVAEAVLWFVFRLGILGESSSSEPPLPRRSLDYAIMLPKIAVAAFAEELVTRCYLITRFEELLRSRWRAVVFAAVAFASYHIYWGLDGAVYSLMFGLAYGIVFLANRRVWPLAIGHTLYNLHVELST